MQARPEQPAGGMMKQVFRFVKDGWSWPLLLVSMLVLTPLGTIFYAVFLPADEQWPHIARNLLPGYIGNSLFLAVLVSAGTLILGVGLAWFISSCEFPGRRVAEWAAILPFAFPTYVTGFVMIGLFDYAGPVQTWVRTTLGVDTDWFPRIRSMGGLALVMSFSYYPYVYLLARNAFMSQGQRANEAARSMGCSAPRAFFKVALPMARPWIMGGLLLVLMECLADFGTVSVFNIDTFTTGIYKAWFGLFSLRSAAQLSCVLVVFTLVLMLLEKRYQSRRRYHAVSRSERVEPRLMRLKGWRRVLVAAAVLTVPAFGFGLPLLRLFVWSVESFATEWGADYWLYIRHTVFVSGASALLIGVCALGAVYARRLKRGRLVEGLGVVSLMGYALPGTVLAIGIYIPMVWLDNGFAAGYTWVTGRETGFFITGTLTAMMAAFLIRFLAVANQPIESAMHRITLNMDASARSLGHSRGSILRRLHVPLLRGGLFTALILVFIDLMKEMPITLMTKPFGWSTLSVRIFELTSEGEFQRAALPSLTLVLTGLVPVVLLTKYANRPSGVGP